MRPRVGPGGSSGGHTRTSRRDFSGNSMRLFQIFEGEHQVFGIKGLTPQFDKRAHIVGGGALRALKRSEGCAVVAPFGEPSCELLMADRNSRDCPGPGMVRISAPISAAHPRSLRPICRPTFRRNRRNAMR